MIKQVICILALSLSALYVHAQQSTISLTNSFKITFPAAPHKQDIGSSIIYKLELADGTADLMAIVTDLEKTNGLTAKDLSLAMMDKDFWKEFESGFLPQVGKDAKVVARSVKTVGRFEGRELIVENPNPDISSSPLVVWLFFDGKNSITLFYGNYTKSADPVVMAKFFGSFTEQ